MAAETLALLFSYLSLLQLASLIAMQRQGWIQGRWIGRLATSPLLAALLVC